MCKHDTQSPTMSVAYSTMPDTSDADPSENDEFESELPVHPSGADTNAAPRRQRVLDFIFCRRNANSMLVIVDAALFAVTFWAYADIVLALTAKEPLGTDGWWVYTLIVVGLLAQCVGIVLRARYACSTQRARRSIEWNLRHISRPMLFSFINALVFDIYLFLAPLYGHILLVNQGMPEDSFGSAAHLMLTWRTAAAQPSSIAFTVLLVLATLCNWRVSAKHRLAVRYFTGILESKTANGDPENRVIGELTARRARTSTLKRPTKPKYVAPSAPAAELRPMHTQQSFVTEYNLNDMHSGMPSDEDEHAGKTGRAANGKRNAKKKTKHVTIRRQGAAGNVLDHSTLSNEDVVGEHW